MFIISRIQSTTSFATSLNRSVTYLSNLFRFDGHVLLFGVYRFMSKNGLINEQ